MVDGDTAKRLLASGKHCFYGHLKVKIIQYYETFDFVYVTDEFGGEIYTLSTGALTLEKSQQIFINLNELFGIPVF